MGCLVLSERQFPALEVNKEAIIAKASSSHSDLAISAVARIAFSPVHTIEPWPAWLWLHRHCGIHLNKSDGERLRLSNFLPRLSCGW